MSSFPASSALRLLLTRLFIYRKVALIYNSATGGGMPYFGTQETGLEAVASLRREDGLKVSSEFRSRSKKRCSCSRSPASRLLQAKSSIAAYELPYRTVGDRCCQHDQRRPRIVRFLGSQVSFMRR